MGAVFRVLDESTGERIALKRLLSRARGTADKLFEHEYHTLTQLRHPRIIEVYEYGLDAEGAYYTMELLDGTDLRDLAPLSYREACRHLRDVASSLALLHARRLLHRDISPRNVRLTSAGRAKLIDFGALTTFGVSERVVGTVPAVPPEALLGLQLDQRSDLYAFGTLCYWVLTKRHAYPARELWLLPSVWGEGAPAPPSQFQADIPPELDDLVLRLLSQDPLSRPISAAEVIEQLERIGQLDSEETHQVGASYLVNPRIVGRDTELEKLRSAVARIKTGKSVTLLVEGVTGVGKTRLLSEVGLEAQLRGATVVRVDAELERGPYAVARAMMQMLLTKLPVLARQAATRHTGLLLHLVPELATSSRSAEPAALPRDRGEQRVRMQMALVEWLTAIARECPLVIIVDNVQAADESSLALFATLPRLASGGQIGLLLGQRTDAETNSPRPLKSIRTAAERVTLRELDQAQTTELVQALFGDVSQAGRLGKWLYDRTAGHPNHCLSLAARLIELKLVTYKNGAWVLPLELDDDAVPSGVPAIFDQQIANLSSAARRLAENLSVERLRISLEQCLAFSELGQSETFSALSELITRGLLVAVGDEYRFAHHAQRERLFAKLSPERQRALHRRAGQFLLRQRDQNPLAEIDAGWHLLRAGDELRGAEILADAGQRLVSTIEGLNFAAPALEAALAVFDRANASPWILLPVLDALTAAGWYVDRRYADKYGERTLRLALRLSGLEKAAQLARVVGDKRAVKLGTLYAAVQHGRQKKHIRHKQFMEFRGVFAPLIGTLGCLIGVAANSMDARGAERVLDAVRMMSAFEEDHIVRVMYDYARYFNLNTAGRLARAEPIGERVLAWLQTPAATSILTQDGTRALSGGVMAGLAQYAAFRDGPSTLEWADRLEALGLSFYSMIANQARFMYHAQRGEMALARPHRDRLELHAIQGGTTWQSSIVVPLTLGTVYAKTGDIVGLRQSIEQLERRAEEIPALVPIVTALRASYELERGHQKEALLLAEQCRAGLGSDISCIGPWIASVCARALLAHDRIDEARQVIEHASAQMDSGDRAYTFLYLNVDLAKVAIDIACASYERARARLDELMAEHAPRMGPLTRFDMHEAYAQLALATTNSAELDIHLQELEVCARNTENPALIARFKRVESAAQRALGQRPSAIALRAARGDSYLNAARNILESKEGKERASAALRIAIEQSGACGGYLYLGSTRHLELVAQQPPGAAPPSQLQERLLEMADHAQRAGDFFSTTAAATAVLSGLACSKASHTDLAGVRVELLILPHSTDSLIVGALVLKPGSVALEPLGFDLLQLLGQSLYGLHDASRGSRHPGSHSN